MKVGARCARVGRLLQVGRALTTLVVAALVLVGPALAASGPDGEAPTELWREYPLDPGPQTETSEATTGAGRANQSLPSTAPTPDGSRPPVWVLAAVVGLLVVTAVGIRTRALLGAAAPGATSRHVSQEVAFVLLAAAVAILVGALVGVLGPAG